jgi:hypothetical protein
MRQGHGGLDILVNNAVVRYLAVRQPSRKFVKDENVAGLIALLCGLYVEDMNGSALPINGAWAASRIQPQASSRTVSPRSPIRARHRSLASCA